MSWLIDNLSGWIVVFSNTKFLFLQNNNAYETLEAYNVSARVKLVDIVFKKVFFIRKMYF